jgi:hypothetical protein
MNTVIEHTMDMQGWLRKQLEQASPDCCRRGRSLRDQIDAAKSRKRPRSGSIDHPSRTSGFTDASCTTP